VLFTSLYHARERSLNERTNHIARLSANAEPLLYEIFLERNTRWIEQWVVGSNNLQEPTISFILLVGGNYAVCR
jgi:hypothetical protein